MSNYGHAMRLHRGLPYWCPACQQTFPAAEVRCERASALTLNHYHNTKIRLRGEVVPVTHEVIRRRR